MSTSYTRDADGVWYRAGFSGLAYTDGSDVERRLGESKLSRAVLFESAVTPWRLTAMRGRLH